MPKQVYLGALARRPRPPISRDANELFSRIRSLCIRHDGRGFRAFRVTSDVVFNRFDMASGALFMDVRGCFAMENPPGSDDFLHSPLCLPWKFPPDPNKH